MTAPGPELPLWELVQTHHLVARGFHERFAAVGLTATQFGVLVSLRDDADDLTQADLARQVLVRPQSMGELVASLVERGFVERAGPGGRGRRTGLRLTGPGRDVLERAWPLVVDYNAPETIGLSAGEATTLAGLLRRVPAALEAD